MSRISVHYVLGQQLNEKLAKVSFVILQTQTQTPRHNKIPAENMNVTDQRLSINVLGQQLRHWSGLLTHITLQDLRSREQFRNNPARLRLCDTTKCAETKK